MSTTASQSSQSRSWWSRSKSSKDVPSLRSNPSNPNLASDAKSYATMGSSKSKDSSTSSKFNTLVATAIGKKPKKPTLTIQDPPSPTFITSPSPSASTPPYSMPSTAATTPAQSPSGYFANRPPAKSVSTVRSYEFDQRSGSYTVSEPRTPSDHPRDRMSYQNSIMTLSDPDPFAAGAIIVPRLTQDPNRLSVWSDSSMTDPHGKRPDLPLNHRISYASSSSNSHGNPSEGHGSRIQPLSPISRTSSTDVDNGDKRHRRETSMLPDTAIPIHLLEMASRAAQAQDQSAPTTAPPTTRRRPSDALPQSTVLPQSRAVAPPLRARGMTVAGERPGTAGSTFSTSGSATGHHRLLHRQASADQFSRSQSPASASSPSPVMFSSARSSLSTVSTAHNPPGSMRPLVLVRKASSSRINLPPLMAAPPSTRLPPPPLSPFTPSDDGASVNSLVFPDPPSSSSSSMTFASIEMDMPDSEEAHHFMRDDPGDNILPPHSPPATVRNISVVTPPRPAPAPPLSLPAVNGKGHGTANNNGFLTSSQVVKKAPSQQSFNTRPSDQSLGSTASSPGDESANASPVGKAPRKQRSFHHPRIPLALPPFTNINSFSFSSDSSSSSRPTTASPPPQTRRRLFSGSSGRRTSLSKSSSTPPSTADDDLRSVFSLDGGDTAARDAAAQAGRSKPVMMSFANMGNQLSLVTDNACIAPSWDEISSTSTPGKRMSQADYVPQHIMSPADMLKLEEQLAYESTVKDNEEAHEAQEEEERRPKLDLEPGDFGLSFIAGGSMKSRSRTNSILSNMSTATLAFGGTDKVGRDDLSLRGVLGIAQTFGTPTRRPSTANEWSPMRNSISKNNFSSASGRPSTALPSLSSPPVSLTSFGQSSPEHRSIGLPPPPRPRREKRESKRNSVAPLHPLSPPPRHKPLKPVSYQEEDSATTSVNATSAATTSNATVMSSRPPSAFNPQKVADRRSIMRKPSFLDIDDEFDQEDDDDTASLMGMSMTSYAASYAASTSRSVAASLPISAAAAAAMDMESSFLDLDRGTDSFDTVRSFDDDLRAF